MWISKVQMNSLFCVLVDIYICGISITELTRQPTGIFTADLDWFSSFRKNRKEFLLIISSNVHFIENWTITPTSHSKRQNKKRFEWEVNAINNIIVHSSLMPVATEQYTVCLCWLWFTPDLVICFFLSFDFLKSCLLLPTRSVAIANHPQLAYIFLFLSVSFFVLFIYGFLCTLHYVYSMIIYYYNNKCDGLYFVWYRIAQFSGYKAWSKHTATSSDTRWFLVCNWNVCTIDQERKKSHCKLNDNNEQEEKTTVLFCCCCGCYSLSFTFFLCLYTNSSATCPCECMSIGNTLLAHLIDFRHYYYNITYWYTLFRSTLQFSAHAQCTCGRSVFN